MSEQTPIDRITAYLSGGGLFNPEYANHDAVRDLLIDCRDTLAAQRTALLYCYEKLQPMQPFEDWVREIAKSPAST